jgi:hypothetical protein
MTTGMTADGAGGGGGGGGGGPSCEAAAEKAMSIPKGVSKLELTADQLRMGKVAFVERCTEDKWTTDVQSCFGAVASRDDIIACRNKLPADAKKALGRDLRERLGRTHTGDVPDAAKGGVKMSADPCEGGE